MVDKVKNINWLMVSVFALLLANSSMVFAISKVSMNTVNMDNSAIIITYSTIGLIAFLLFKLNNAAIRRLPKN